MRLVENNLKFNYRVYNSEYVKKYHSDFMLESYLAVDKFNHLYKDQDTTWTYSKYNIFNLTACSLNFHQLYKELIHVVKDYTGNQGPLWIQSWINFHKPEAVLDWHDHQFPYHGYISIEPKKSITDFKEFQITNEIGNIYIGHGHRPHRVVVTEPYEGERITLGFDIATEEFQTESMSFIPLV